ncbi:hypothetical protein [Amycolatopsis sp. WQ 127309]|uniref:hypothetical protein n=1 Tax=Amycolatopsis sp. WQ 127309 TaxID=2932773 RepID=UPI001FF15430|nr:hypothetical protein [Amycolatopsis sp. WQ 127309]UOZ09948.1 hypothetical protein MUY22_17410 [Amycolatopsis sp. WQ 127309]
MTKRFADPGAAQLDPGMAKRRYVARGVPGGYRIWDNKGRRWWGDHYELCPDDLLAELNGAKDPATMTALLKRHRAQRR